MRTIYSIATLVFTLVACPPPDDDPAASANWETAFDTEGYGALSGVWGTAPDDVWIVGGTPEQADIIHFDGGAWTAMDAPAVGLLVWVYGFAPDDVFAVGLDGAAVHWDGAEFEVLDAGTDEDLWGVWGRSSDDLWVVGGDVGTGDPLLLRWDGSAFTPQAVPDNDRNATSLFKVWGIGEHTWAVGERGLILSYDGTDWAHVAAGADADDDFVSLWGPSDQQVVAVGGRSNGRIATFDGTEWSTIAPEGVPGLNAVYMTDASEAVVAGIYGFAGSYDPATDEVTVADPLTGLDLHALWGDGAGNHYCVGGRFFDPYEGVALVRTDVEGM